VRIGVKPGQWGWEFEDLAACWQTAEDCGFDVVSCFDHVSAAPAGLAAWDAPSLLTAMAGVTSRIRLSVDVINVALRHPFLLAGQLVVAQAASRGRIEVGLGAGSFHLARHDHLAVSIPFPPFGRRVELLAHCCDVLPRLFRGQRVSDPMLGFVDASLGPVDVPVPPIYVGGSSDRVLRVAAAHADGWNVVVSDAKRFAELSARVDALCRQLDRSRPLVKAAQVFVRDVGFSKARRLLDELDRAGADAATFVLVDEKGPRAVEQLAATVLR